MSDSGTKTEKKTARGRAAEAPRVALDRGLKIARWPADAAVRIAPKTRGVRRAAESVVDRTDAAVRGAAGAALRNDKFREEAKELRKKAEERAHEATAEREKTEPESEAKKGGKPSASTRTRKTPAKSTRSRKTTTATKETPDPAEAADAKGDDERTEALQDEAEAAVEEKKAAEAVAEANGDR